jgi:hypothetical protein
LAAIGLGTAVGFALFGTVAIVIGAVLIGFVVLHRRRTAAACGVAETPEPVPVELTDMRSRS